MGECLREMAVEDLEMVRAWRNHPDIKKFMFAQKEVLPEEHLAWFERARKSEVKNMLIYMENASPFGFIQFTAIRNQNTIVDWGFYVAPNANKGTGTKMTKLGLDYAFNQLKAHKVFAEVLEYNVPSIRLHQKLGFSQEGVLRDHYFDGKKYHAVLCFGLVNKSVS
jgi:UDP-4-amino-4,6-dideoxy-N-acetyl-beta-L-altrosamine N-acetyltransferase